MRFIGHPGVKSGMIEDLIMEFEESPSDSCDKLSELRNRQAAIEDATIGIMTGLVQAMRLMQKDC